MLLNKALGFGDLRRFQTVVGVKDHRGLRLTNGMLNMHMRPRFLAREEVEPVAAYSQDRRTHGHQNSAARMGDGQPSTAVGNGFEVGGRQSRRIPLDLPGATGDLGYEYFARRHWTDSREPGMESRRDGKTARGKRPNKREGLAPLSGHVSNSMPPGTANLAPVR